MVLLNYGNHSWTGIAYEASFIYRKVFSFLKIFYSQIGTDFPAIRTLINFIYTKFTQTAYYARSLITINGIKGRFKNY